MLTKIKKIKNIGSIEEVTKVPSTFDFGDEVIFYGLNGSGKTTVTAILKSLRSNNLDILKGRKSLLNGDDSEVEFMFSEDRIRFKNKWLFANDDLSDEQRPKILVFDDEFIKNNIFAEEFEIGHKKSIHRIIFGADGGKLSDKIKEARQTKKDLEQEKVQALSRIEPAFFQKEEYIKIDISKLDENDLLKQKKETEKKINELENLNKIKLKPGLGEISVTDFDFVKTDDFWEYNIDSEAHTEAKKQVNDFKKEYFKNPKEAEAFIRTGYTNTKEEKKCPFCHAEIDDKLLDLYKEYFNDAYGKWIIKISDYKKDLEGWNISAIKERVNATIEKNDTQFEYWKGKKTELSLCQVDLSTVFEELETIKQEGLEMIANKIDDPSQVIDKHGIHRINARKDAQLKLIENYNEWVTEQNKLINEYKEELEKVDSSGLKNEKSKINDKISRLSDDEVKKCDKYHEVESKLSGASKDVDKRVEELNEYTKKIVDKYTKSINDKLKSFGCHNFEISEFVHKTGENAKDPYVEIVLKVLDKEINMSKSKTDEPCFKNTLSKGEKNTLAFAFFLSFFEEEINNKGEYILVFDDPLTSNDDNREDDTAFEIKKISSQVKQVIVFTHKKAFLQRLYNKFGKNPTYIKVEKNSNKTDFKEQDIDELFLENYKKIIDRFEDILANGISEDLREDDLCKDIRQIFEHVLWSKYYDLIKQNADVMSGRKQLINKQALEDIFFSKGYLATVKEDFLDLCKIGNESSHNNDNQLNSEQVKTKITKTLDVIKKL